MGIVKSQAVKGGANILQSVSAASADDIWTVGEYYNPNTNPFAEHWDGSKMVACKCTEEIFFRRVFRRHDNRFE